MARPETITSRTLSTCVCVAASISRTSMSRPCAISTHASQTPHGSAVGPCTQLRPRARMRAVVVLPTPRGPENTNDCAMRLAAIALRSVCVTPRWPMTSSNRCGRHLRAMTWNDIFGNVFRIGRGASHRDPEKPAAHVSICLALLPSGPDAVRRLILHRFRAAVRRAGPIAALRRAASDQCTLFLPKGGDRIDAAGATGRKIRGHSCGDQDDENGHERRQAVPWRNAEQLTAYLSAGDGRASDP